LPPFPATCGTTIDVQSPIATSEVAKIEVAKIIVPLLFPPRPTSSRACFAADDAYHLPPLRRRVAFAFARSRRSPRPPEAPAELRTILQPPDHPPQHRRPLSRRPTTDDHRTRAAPR